MASISHPPARWPSATCITFASPSSRNRAVRLPPASTMPFSEICEAAASSLPPAPCGFSCAKSGRRDRLNNGRAKISSKSSAGANWKLASCLSPSAVLSSLADAGAETGAMPSLCHNCQAKQPAAARHNAAEHQLPRSEAAIPFRTSSRTHGAVDVAADAEGGPFRTGNRSPGVTLARGDVETVEEQIRQRRFQIIKDSEQTVRIGRHAHPQCHPPERAFADGRQDLRTFQPAAVPLDGGAHQVLQFRGDQGFAFAGEISRLRRRFGLDRL